MKLTRVCAQCKSSFYKDSMVQYFSSTGKTSSWYCKDCYEEKIAREKFQYKVCQIFGLKSPGPRIWTERKRLRDKYGYTDDIIIECLEYIYDVQKTKKLSDTLCLINPTTVDKMMQYKRKMQFKSHEMFDAMNVQQVEHIVNARENTVTNKTEWNPDDWI